MRSSRCNPVLREHTEQRPTPRGDRHTILAVLATVVMVAGAWFAASAHATVATKSAPTSAADKYQMASGETTTPMQSEPTAVKLHEHAFTIATKSAATAAAAAYRQATTAKGGGVIRGEQLVFAHRGTIGRDFSPSTVGGMTLVVVLVMVVMLGLAAASRYPRRERRTGYRQGQPRPAA